MKTAIIEQPSLPPVTDEMSRAADAVGNVALVVPQPTGATMFERLAADPNVPVDKLERLIAMQERIEANNARAAFNAAFAEMQVEIPTVHERGKTDKATYARLEDIIEAVRPILGRHGFALSHRTEWPDAKTVKVIGILMHREGHSRESEFLSAADASGSKNAIQGLGSAVAYGRRYTTKDLLNIATSDEDDDGARTGPAGGPDGYSVWLESMEDVAVEGTGRLQVEFQKSAKAFKEYATSKDISRWRAIKAKAAKVVQS
jgi:hypothetical protein